MRIKAGNQLSGDAQVLDFGVSASLAEVDGHVQVANGGSRTLLQYGAKGDGTTDDASAIQAAIDAASVAGATAGQMVVLDGGGREYLVGSTLTWKSYVYLDNAYLKLANGVNADLVQGDQFGTLTGSNSQLGIKLFGFGKVTLDGNNANNTGTSWPLRFFGANYELATGFRIVNGVSGGLWTEWGTGGQDMEAHWGKIKIGLCTGVGLEFRGPHDTQAESVIVWKNTDGIHCAGNGNGLQSSNSHAWGAMTNYAYDLETEGNWFKNAYADGQGIIVNAARNHWDGYLVNPSATPGLTAISLGPSVAATRCDIRAHIRDFASALVCGTESSNSLDLIIDTAGPNGAISGGPATTDRASIVFVGQTSTNGQQTRVQGYLRLAALAADPAAPSAGEVELYTKNDTNGKTDLYARFHTGATRIIGSEVAPLADRNQALMNALGVFTENIPSGRQAARGSSILVDGTVYYMAVGALTGDVFNKIVVEVTAAGSGVTLSKVGLYDTSLNLLASSVDQGTAWQSAGPKEIALQSPYTVAADGAFYIAVVAKASTTLPTLLSGFNFGPSGALSGKIAPYGTQTSQTDLPNPGTLGATSPIALYVAAE